MSENTEPRFSRDKNYRNRYFNRHNGFGGIFICPYCGRLMTRKNATVDHLIPVDKVKKHILWRSFFVGKKHGVNDSSNLVVACRKCNSRKGNRVGWWPIRGRMGMFVFPAIWICSLTLFLVFVSSQPAAVLAALSYLSDFVSSSFVDLWEGVSSVKTISS